MRNLNGFPQIHCPFNTQCTYHVILLVSLVLFLRLFQALLTFVLNMMDDNDDNVYLVVIANILLSC